MAAPDAGSPLLTISGFAFDPGSDRTYPLTPPHELNSTCPLGTIPLGHANRPLLESLAAPGREETYTEALLIPTDSGRSISVVVEDTVVGLLPDVSAASDSQLARVYASGYIPSCTLQITPGGSHLARVLLVSPEMCLPQNNPPMKDWALLPDGTFWQVEPTRLSPFREMPDKTQVLLELRSNGDLTYTYLNGVECGILDVSAAEAVSGAVAHAQDLGLVPVVRGFVEASPDRDQIDLKITALPFAEWNKAQRRLSRNPLPRLIPHSTDPADYRPGMLRLIEEHSGASVPSPRSTTWLARLLQTSGPLLTLGLGVSAIAVGLALSGISSGAAFGVISLGVALSALGIWACACRRRDTAEFTQPRYWNVIAPVAVGIVVPAMSFTVVGMIMDARTNLEERRHPDMVTMPSLPFDALLADDVEGDVWHPSIGESSFRPSPSEVSPESRISALGLPLFLTSPDRTPLVVASQSPESARQTPESVRERLTASSRPSPRPATEDSSPGQRPAPAPSSPRTPIPSSDTAPPPPVVGERPPQPPPPVLPPPSDPPPRGLPDDLEDPDPSGPVEPSEPAEPSEPVEPRITEVPPSDAPTQPVAPVEPVPTEP